MTLNECPTQRHRHKQMVIYDLHPSVTAFSTERHCAVTDAPYDGFNITPYTGDAPTHVTACRQELCRRLHIDDSNLVLPHQVHGTQIAEITAANLSSPLEGIDAVVTQLANTCIGVSTADCVPILLYDSRNRAIAAVHAGWRGTVARIASKTLIYMRERFGTQSADVRAIIGPSIGPDAFEVGDEVVEAFATSGFDTGCLAFKKLRDSAGPTEEPRWHIDLWAANAADLRTADVPPEAITITGLCTFTYPARFFSARRLGINSGRMFTGCVIKGD